MSRFYGSMNGATGKQVTRTGTSKSGVTAHVRGWCIGVRVYVAECPDCGGDRIVGYETGGSKGPRPRGDELFNICQSCDKG